MITATQMLESMITSPVPTRAEVTDVANAVLDGTSAVMLSGETAIGADPVLVVATMARIVQRTERDFDYLQWGANLGVQEVPEGPFSLRRITASITGAAWRAAQEEDAAVIIACTQSGATARAIARFRPRMPIVAVTPEPRTLRQLSMSWGVEPLLALQSASTDDDTWLAVRQVVAAGFAEPGDVVVVIAGSPYRDEPRRRHDAARAHPRVHGGGPLTYPAAPRARATFYGAAFTIAGGPSSGVKPSTSPKKASSASATATIVSARRKPCCSPSKVKSATGMSRSRIAATIFSA